MAVDCLSSLNVRRNSLRLRVSPYSQYTLCTISVNTIIYIYICIYYISMVLAVLASFSDDSRPILRA